jgi:endonuclease/exonuclease/phosphatase family metal-dependent hydrolase
VTDSPVLELKICEFNLENLFISMEYYEGEDLEKISEEGWRWIALPQLRSRQKPLSKLWALARAILDIDADVLMLVEVGGKDSLESFNRHFLGDRYEPFFVEGNSDRGIDLGFLVRRGLAGLRAEARSNRDLPVEVMAYAGKYAARFSRDVAELRLSGSDAQLRLILLLVHLKSKISKEGDFKGKDARTAEAIALAELYRKRRSEHPEAPIVVGGDFNADLSSLELELIQRTDLMDFQDALAAPPEERYTLVYFDPAGNPKPEVIDYLLVSPHLRDRIVEGESRVYRYKGFYGIEEDAPRSIEGRYRMPSDHYPVVLKMRLPEEP